MTTTARSEMTATDAEAAELGRDWRSKPEHLWTAFDRSEAYLESRPVGGPYNPAAEYGDPDWREPESDVEAAARTAHLDAQPRDPETRAWVERVAAISAEERAEIDAGVELTHARATHDPDEIAEATARCQAAARARERAAQHTGRDHGERDGRDVPWWLDGEFTEPECEDEFEDEEVEL